MDAEPSLETELAAARARIAKLEEEQRATSALARLARIAPAFIAEVERDGTFLGLSQFAAGFSAADIAGKTIFDFTAPDHRDALRACLEHVIATKQASGVTSVAAGASGHDTRWYTQLAPILDEGGEVATVALVATDVSPASEAMRALEESEAKLRLVLDASRMGTFVVDPSHPDLMASADARLLEIGGVSTGPAFSTVHPDDLPMIQAAFAEVLAGPGARGPYEVRIIRPDGSLRWIHAFGTARRAPNGEVSVVGGVLDVTERKTLEDVIAKNEKLESIGRLAGGIAHDFNNMLTAILAYAELALDTVDADSTIAGDLREIRGAAERSATLTKQILAFAREQEFSPRALDPNGLVLDVDKLLRRVLGEDIELVTVLEATSLVAADGHQIEQVLLNLATNARYAMKEGGRFTLTTSDVVLDASTAGQLAMAPGAGVKVTATDTGEGMTEEVRLRAFEPFFTTKGRSAGTGLGLATSYGIVRKHRGGITVRSAPGEGAVFEIFLPVTVGAPAPESETVRGPTQAQARGGTERVLVVEDEPRVRALVVKTLQLQGYDVLEARNGLEALTVIEEHGETIDLVVSDDVMPQMSGRELARRLGAVRAELPVLLMSGYSDELGARGGQGVDFLSKPFVSAQLTAKVRAVLDRDHPRRSGST